MSYDSRSVDPSGATPGAGAAASSSAIGKSPLVPAVAAPAVQLKTDDAAGAPAAAPGGPPAAALDTTKHSVIQEFDGNAWNLNDLTAKSALGLKSSPSAYIEVVANWQSDASIGTSSEIKEKAAAHAATIRKALQQWGAFPDDRVKSSTFAESIDGTAPKGSFKEISVWFKTGAAAAAPVVPGSGLGAGPLVPGPGLGTGPGLGAGPGAAASPDVFAPVPPNPTKRIKDLGDLIAAAGDAVTKDKLVRELTGLVAKIKIADDMRKKLDDAIKSGVGEGIKAALQKVLEAIAGKSATNVPNEIPSHTGPDVKQKDLNEKILKTPDIPLPFDQPPALHRTAFEFRALKPTYAPGDSIDVTLLTPDGFVPGVGGGSRVVVIEVGDYQKNNDSATTVQSAEFHEKGSVSVSVQAPPTPGSYMLGVKTGLSGVFDLSKEFKVAKP